MARGRGGFPGGGMGGGNMQQMIKQAQKMQEQIQQAQEGLEEKEFSGSAGGDMVKATVSGKLKLLSLSIDPQAVDPDDVEMLEDIVLAAVKAAQENAETSVEEEMGKLTGGMNLGGLF